MEHLFWYLQIRRHILNPELKDRTISELVANDYRMADILRQFGIEICCSTVNHSLQDACDKKSLSLHKILYALETISTEKLFPSGWHEGSLEQILDEFEFRVHRFFKSELPTIGSYLDRFEGVHEAQLPEFGEIAHWWKALSTHLSEYMFKLEMAVYPYMRKLATQHTPLHEMEKPAFGSLMQVWIIFDLEQRRIQTYADQIALLTHTFQPPFTWCTTLVVLYQKLGQLSHYLNAYLNGNREYVFPRAIALETEIMA